MYSPVIIIQGRMKLPESAAHDKYMFFSILYIVGIVFVFAIIIPNIAHNQPVTIKIFIWILSIIVMLAIAILSIVFIERNKKVKKHKKSNGLRLIGGRRFIKCQIVSISELF